MKSAKLWMFVAVLMMGIVPAFAQTNVNEEQGMNAIRLLARRGLGQH